jgi:Ser/Thr protein kinase RdoA (MazF antagonist)
MHQPPMNTVNEYNTYRLLIERRNGSEILLVPDGHLFALPAVEIPPWERVAPQVTNALEKNWNIETYCLFSPALEHSRRNCTDRKYQLLETCHPDATLPRAWSWTEIASLSENMFANLDDFRIIHSAMKELAAYASGSIPGFFGKARWLEEVFAWIEQTIDPLGLCLTGQFRQLNASPTFSLIRFETNGPALWFKAVGEPNLHEYSATLTLAKFFPACVPKIIATQADWNAWLTTEAQGAHPDENSAGETWATVAKRLAELQFSSLGQTLHVLDAGFRDVRICSLVELVDPFLENMAGLMEQQTTNSPPRLLRPEIQTLGTELQELLSDFETLAIPNTLGHLDLNPGNILVSGDRCVFLDWAEGSVGHPFLTFQYLLEHLKQLRPADESSKRKMLSTYTEVWRSVLNPREIAEGLAAAPLLAVLAYAVAGDAWRDPARLSQPHISGHLRSLTRRMKREVALLSNRRRCRKSLVEGELDVAVVERLPSCGS